MTNIKAKTGIWLALASLLLAFPACSDDEVLTVDTLPVALVTFRVQSRAPLTRASDTKAGQINALVVNGRTSTVDFTRSEILLDGVTMYRLKGTESRFDYSPHRYYPSWAEIAEFNAYSPVSGRVEGFNAGNGESADDNTITYSVPDPAASVPQEDLLVASTATAVTLSGYVLFTMRHALSRIHVRAQNMMIYPVIIHHITLHNLYGRGTLDVNACEWNTAAYPAGSAVADINRAYVETPADYADYKILWKPAGNRDASYSWRLPPAGAVVPATGATEQITSDDQAMLVMPQITVNTGNDGFVTPEDMLTDFYMEIGYTIQNYTTTARVAFADVNALPQTARKEGIVFEMGKQYGLTVCFTQDAVTFSVNVGDWYETTVLE